MTCQTCRPVHEPVLSPCVCLTQQKTKIEGFQSSQKSESSLGSGSEQTRLGFNAHDLLRTRYHPECDSDLIRIHAFLDTAQASLISLDSGIAHAQQVLSDLLSKRATLQQSITSHKSLLSPIRRLPNELLSEIFLSRDPLCGNDSADIGSSASFTYLHTDSLWTITQVCSLWRTTAQLTPRLWSNLIIDLSSLKGKPTAYNSLLARLSLCLEHLLPTTLPLNFAIIGTHYQDSAHLFPLIELLCIHADRWGKVYFCPYTTNILASPKLDSRFHNLSSTPQLSAIGLTSFNPTPGMIQTPTQFMHVPHLRKLAVYDYRSLSTTSDTSLILPSYCGQLTHLYLDSCPYYAYTEILSYLPHLVYLEIINKYQQATRFTDTVTTTQPIIHLPELRKFKAVGWLSNLCLLLPSLALPVVERIEILALTEQCHPCTCATVKTRMINDWVETLNKDVVFVVNQTASWEVKTSTEQGILNFIFTDN